MRRLLALAFAIAALGGAAWWFAAKSEPSAVGPAAVRSVAVPPFDPVSVAAAETAMWKAYYGGNPESVFAELARLLELQAGLSASDATAVAGSMGMAAAKFQAVPGQYERLVLPDLVAGYERMKSAAGESFDAERAARAELEWWVRRRTPGKDSDESVGESIADLYEALYGVRNDATERAGLLRAQAAKLRDDGGGWVRVEQLLVESHESLLAGIAARE